MFDHFCCCCQLYCDTFYSSSLLQSLLSPITSDQCYGKSCWYRPPPWQQNHWCWSSALHTRAASWCCSQEATMSPFSPSLLPLRVDRKERRWSSENRDVRKETQRWTDGVEIQNSCLHLAFSQLLPPPSLRSHSKVLCWIVSPSNLHLSTHIGSARAAWPLTFCSTVFLCSQQFFSLYVALHTRMWYRRRTERLLAGTKCAQIRPISRSIFTLELWLMRPRLRFSQSDILTTCVSKCQVNEGYILGFRPSDWLARSWERLISCVLLSNSVK